MAQSDELPHNLLSFSRLDRQDYKLMVSNGKAMVRSEQNKIIFVGNLKRKDLYG